MCPECTARARICAQHGRLLNYRKSYDKRMNSRSERGERPERLEEALKERRRNGRAVEGARLGYPGTISNYAGLWAQTTITKPLIMCCNFLGFFFLAHFYEVFFFPLHEGINSFNPNTYSIVLLDKPAFCVPPSCFYFCSLFVFQDVSIWKRISQTPSFFSSGRLSWSIGNR